MLFSAHDVDLLRMLRWCQYMHPSDESEFSNLLTMKFIKVHATSGAFILTSKGHDFLEKVYGDKLPIAYQTYRPDAIVRKLSLSKIMNLFYSSGSSVFNLSINELTKTPSIFLPAVTRGRVQNPWSNTRIAAVANFPDMLCNVHFVRPEIGKILLYDELSTFSNNTSTLNKKAHSMIFVGETLSTILNELESEIPETNDRLISYGEAYRKCPIPVHLCSCDVTGVTQLRIMSQENYREKLTKFILKSRYRPPPKAATFDAIFDERPFALAVDMDLHRIDKLCKSEQNLSIAALDGQVREVLNLRYNNKCRIFTLTQESIDEFLGEYKNPRNEVFISPKGDVIHAQIIPNNRKN